MKTTFHRFSPALNLLNRSVSEDQVVRFILSEREKYQGKQTAVKKLFNYYESIGMVQVRKKRDEVKKLYNQADGVIDTEDYVEVEKDYANMIGNPNRLDTDLLKFYPITPTIINAVLGGYDKSFTKYNAQAVNPEATNELLNKMNDDLRTVLIQSIESLFYAKNSQDPPDVLEQKKQLLMQSKEVQSAYTKTYRSTVEQWANHRINLEDQYYNTKQIERQLLKQILVTGDPVCHVNYVDGNYYPEVLQEKDTFCIQSPSSRDYSDSMMFGWFEYLTFTDALNKNASLLKEEDVEKLSRWGQGLHNQNFVVNNMSPEFTRAQGRVENRNNYNVYQSISDIVSKYSDDPLNSTALCKVTNIYFYIPRKVGRLYFKSRGSSFQEIVDENHKVTIPPIYEAGRPRTAEYLIQGEHIEWTYISELWRGKKISTGTDYNQPLAARNELGEGNDDFEIWLTLERHPIQYSDPYFKYGVQIPVHGGPESNQFGYASSWVKLIAPHQITFNWIHNRNNQLLSTEIGKFFLINEALIPNQSLEGEWSEEERLEKFALTGRDVGIVPLANPINNMGAGALGISGGVGQTIDLTKTEEIIQKTNLAQLIKIEAYATVGLTPEFVYGDNSPTQSAKSVALGQQRTSSQVQPLLTRLNEIVTKLRTTMLATAKFIAIQSPTVEMSYNTQEEGRQLFKSSTEDFTLPQLGVFAQSNASDLSVIENIKQYVASNNTMGADALETATLLSFKSLPEVFEKLKQFRLERQLEKDKEYKQAQELQAQQIQAAQASQQVEIETRERKEQLDRENNVMVAQIKALGYAEGDAETIQKAILDLRTANDDQKMLYERAALERQMSFAKERQDEQKAQNDSAKLALEQRIKLKAVEQKDRELDLRKMDIEARNRRTRKID